MRVNRLDLIARVKAARLYCGAYPTYLKAMRVEAIPGGLALEGTDTDASARAVLVAKEPTDENWATTVDPQAPREPQGPLRHHHAAPPLIGIPSRPW